ncbi:MULTISPECIES: NAD(P)H:quinone oxidoreductase [unclassified Streptomyces]|uniref:NAD(P)H:quinone oxidoreductase n=1 Tax=unclassified Streptomyces TaxID=2593676 RepID=UPI000708C453|nr:NAD(P)H:quinone oxidoreductase [Streptomyces sp. Root1310]KQX72258.1 NAD(P)H dehydrogenase [Streptomyces sp. Root1310]
MATVNVSIIYYSATGNVHTMAQAAAAGAQKAGATVRLRKVRELAPPEAIASNPAWARHAEDSAGVEVATLDDLSWADAVLFGTPTRFGNVSSQLKAFIDTAGPLWQTGALADKVVSAFTSTGTAHGGQESTILALSNTFYHWGGIIVPPGYTDPIQFKTGNPYGTSYVSGAGGANGGPGEDVLQSAGYQARRVVDIACAIKAGRAAA